MLILLSSLALLRVFLLDGMLMSHLLILWELVLLLMLLVVFSRKECTGSRRDFFVGCPNALAASHACYVADRWFTPHFSVLARFRSGALMADVACPVVCQPIWPACWLDTPDGSSSSSTRVVQDVWDVYRDELGVVPEEVVMPLRNAASRSSVDDFWTIWSRNAELGLFRTHSKAGRPVVAGSSAFLGRGLLRIRSWRLGGRAVGGRGSSRLYRVSQGDEVDVHCAQYFVGSSLAPVLLFRRRLKSVAVVLRGIKSKGFTQTRWDALLGYWRAVCRHGPCGPWDNWVPPDLHCFFRWVFDSLEVLNGFLKQVVVSRRDIGIRKWTMWLREDLCSRPYAWFRPDFVLPSPFLIIEDPQSSRILVEPHLIDAEFRKAWLPFFLLDFVGHLLPQEPYLDLPRIIGRDLQEVARAKKNLLLVVWMAGLGMKLRHFRCPCFLVWLFF